MVTYNIWPLSDFSGLHVRAPCASGFLKALKVVITLFTLKLKGHMRHKVKIVLSIFKYIPLYSSRYMVSNYQS